MSIEAALALLDKELGANTENDTVENYLDTGFAPLNKIMSGKYDGGLPYGRIVEMFGDSSTGKTALASAWMTECQRVGGYAAFIDFERSFNSDFAKEGGLTTDNKQWRYFRPKTWEEGNTFAAKLCKLVREQKVIDPAAPILIVFDSIAAAIPRSSIDKGMDEYNMNDTTALARATSSTLKVMAHFAEEYNAIFLYLNQIRLKPGVVYGDPRTTPGGRATEYYATIRLALSRTKNMGKMEGEKTKSLLSQTISIQCTKSKLTGPYKETDIEMVFDDRGVGSFDTTPSLLDHVADKGYIESSGAWVTWTDGKKYQKGVLVKKIKDEGLLAELKSLLPK